MYSMTHRKSSPVSINSPVGIPQVIKGISFFRMDSHIINELSFSNQGALLSGLRLYLFLGFRFCPPNDLKWNSPNSLYLYNVS